MAIYKFENTCKLLKSIIQILRYILESGASVSFYMFFGGTNFGFTAGANYDGPGHYKADITSYDYDAPMDEAGDPTPKYMLIRDAIKDYLPLPNISVPERSRKMQLAPVQLMPKVSLLSTMSRQKLGRIPIKSQVPVTFEEIDQYSGFVLYETILPKSQRDPGILNVPQIKDRAIVLIDDVRCFMN